jgi:hypothetical protein
MSSLFVAFLSLVASSFLTRAALQAEILALRHQLTVLQKNAPPRLRLQRSDRLLWVLPSRWWPGWRRSLHIVRPDTVIAWHRRAFAWYWTRKSRRRPGRPSTQGAECHRRDCRLSTASLWPTGANFLYRLRASRRLSGRPLRRWQDRQYTDGTVAGPGSLRCAHCRSPRP